MQNECMASITIRDVPDDTLAELRVRAARDGRSMQEYLRGHLVEFCRHPTIEVVVERALGRRAASGVTLDDADVLADLDADRR